MPAWTQNKIAVKRLIATNNKPMPKRIKRKILVLKNIDKIAKIKDYIMQSTADKFDFDEEISMLEGIFS